LNWILWMIIEFYNNISIFRGYNTWMKFFMPRSQFFSNFHSIWPWDPGIKIKTFIHALKWWSVKQCFWLDISSWNAVANQVTSLRCHCLKLFKSRLNANIGKYVFLNRSLEKWSKLSGRCAIDTFHAVWNWNLIF